MLLLRGMFVFLLVDGAWPKSDWTRRYTSEIGKLRCTPVADKLWGKALESTPLEKFPPCLFPELGSITSEASLKEEALFPGKAARGPAGAGPLHPPALQRDPSDGGEGGCWLQRWFCQVVFLFVCFYFFSSRKEDFLLCFLYFHCLIVSVLSTRWLWMVIRGGKK